MYSMARELLTAFNQTAIPKTEGSYSIFQGELVLEGPTSQRGF